MSYETRHFQLRPRYVIPCDPRTSVHLTRREALRRRRSLWRALTDEQRATWNATARGARTRRLLNQSGPLSGYLLFE